MPGLLHYEPHGLIRNASNSYREVNALIETDLNLIIKYIMKHFGNH